MDAIVSGKVESMNGIVFTALSVEENILFDTTQYFSIPSEKANAILIRYKNNDYLNQKQIIIKTFSQTFPIDGMYNRGYILGEDYRVEYSSPTQEPYYYKVLISIDNNYNTGITRLVVSNSNRMNLSNFITSIEIGTLE